MSNRVTIHFDNPELIGNKLAAVFLAKGAMGIATHDGKGCLITYYEESATYQGSQDHADLIKAVKNYYETN